MSVRYTLKHFLYKLGGYYLIAHELLHVLAYRLIGKSYHYEWGDYSVQPLAERTRPERLLVLLFPFVTCWVLGFFFHFLWLLSAIFLITIPLDRYLVDGPTWHFALPIIASLFILYSGTAYEDLIIAYHLLFGKYKSNYHSYEPHRQTEDKQTHRH